MLANRSWNSKRITSNQPAEMWRPNPVLLLATAILLVLSSRAAACDGEPLVTAITKDASTSLYTVLLKDGNPLVLDLSGPLIWSTCDSSPRTPVGCASNECLQAHRYQPPNVPYYSAGQAGGYGAAGRCNCTAHPQNPLTGETAQGDLANATLSANSTDGSNPLHPESLAANVSCAPDSLLAKLPAGAVGVAGLGRTWLSLPAQAGRTQKVADKFALCLPSSSGTGVAIFGGGPLTLVFPPDQPDITAWLTAVPLHRYDLSAGYYVWADKGIAVNHEPVALGDHGPLIVGFSSTVPYTALRADVYRAVVDAFDKAFGRYAAVGAVAPFELCYDAAKLSSTRLGYAVPQIDLMLEGGADWTLFGGNSMVQVSDGTVCLAFVQMKAGGGYGATVPAAAAVIGGRQMEDNLVVFDEDKGQLGFTGLLWGRQTTCSNFNFTMADDN